jgi:hypothetical protein
MSVDKMEENKNMSVNRIESRVFSQFVLKF